MNRPLSAVLHPLGFELGRQLGGAAARHAQVAQWNRIHGDRAEPPPMRLIAEHPLVASSRLQSALDEHLAQLRTFLAPRFAAAAGGDALRAWSGLPAPDVVCADLAIVVDSTAPDGWSLRWVEFQAFASVISTMHTMHLGAMELWPATAGLEPWRLPTEARDWRAAVRGWSAPKGGILLERALHAQLSRFDLQAAAHFFGLPLVDPSQLGRTGSQLHYRDEGGSHHQVGHVFNRLVMHELDDHGKPGARAQFERLAGGADVSWHSHPAWYYGLSKAWLPDLPQPAGQRCTTAATWRELGLSAEALVAKNCHSHGGAAVHLHVTAADLDALPNPTNWVVQPRYTPQPLFSARDGQPVFGEIRCVLALPAGEEPWLATQMLRLSRSVKASAAALAEAPGTGLALLYRPPEG